MAKVVGELIDASNRDHVLIVEDEDNFFEILEITLKSKWTANAIIERARNLSEIDDLIRLWIHKYSMIIFDWQLKDHSRFPEVTTQKINEIRHNHWFRWIMVAASSNDDILEDQLKAWCDFKIRKMQIPKIISELCSATWLKVQKTLENYSSITA